MTLESSRDNNKPMSDSVVEPAQPTPIPIPDIITRYNNGESLDQLASESGVTRHTLYRWMFSGLGDIAYDQAITNALIRRISDADESLENAEDSLAYNKAHARARLQRQDFERRRPKLYGIKQEVSTDSKITVIIQRERTATPQQVVVEAQSVRELTDNTVDSVNPQ